MRVRAPVVAGPHTPPFEADRGRFRSVRRSRPRRDHWTGGRRRAPPRSVFLLMRRPGDGKEPTCRRPRFARLCSRSRPAAPPAGGRLARGWLTDLRWLKVRS